MAQPPFVLALAALLAFGCQRAPRPLVAGTDACDYCRMTVSDTRLGGEIQSRTGRLHTFDAVECLASFYLDAASRDEVRQAWVADFETGRFVPVDSARFLLEGSLRSPMGRALVAFAPEAMPGAAQQYGGRNIGWTDVLDLMRARGIAPGAMPPDTARDTSRAPHP